MRSEKPTSSPIDLSRDSNPVRALIIEECNYIKNLLLTKNADYGNSAFEGIGIFSQLGPEEALKVRIDDKLRRIQNGFKKGGEDRLHYMEDSLRDTVGYLILLKVMQRMRTSFPSAT